MNYTKLITKKKQYKYSVNICLDLRTEERLADFIPNLTTTEIIREYLGGIIRGNSDTHSRILYGSYGTGKSHLLTVTLYDWVKRLRPIYDEFRETVDYL